MIEDRMRVAVQAIPERLERTQRLPFDAALVPIDFEQADPFTAPVIVLRRAGGVVTVGN